MRLLYCLLLVGLAAFVGCQKLRPVDYSKTIELTARQLNAPIPVEAATVARTVTVKVACATACDAYLVIGPTDAVMARLADGQEPKEGTIHSKLGGTGGKVSVELPPNNEFSVILRNPGNEKISAEVKMTAVTK